MRTCLIVVAVILGTANAVLLGADRCAWGPSYWCSHISNAKECGAFKHCVDAVWTKQTISQDGQGVPCTFCQMLFNETRQMIKNKAAQVAIMSFLESGCNFLPDPSLKEQCDLIIKDYVPELFWLLNCNATSEQICAAIQLCAGFEDRVHVSKEVPRKTEHAKVITQTVKQNNVCADCTKFITDIQNMVTDNATISQTEAMFKQTICAQLGELQQTCDELVDQYVPMVLQMLAQQIDPNIVCNVIGFCNSGDLKKAMLTRLRLKHTISRYNKKPFGNTEEGTICKTAMKDLQEYLRDPADQAEVKNLIENKICSALPSFLVTECKNLTETYATLIFELLVAEFDPDAVCALFGFCRNSTITHKPKILAAKIISPAKSIVKDVSCDMCKEAVHWIEGYLQENKTEEEIKTLMDDLCNALPDTYRNTCISIVQQYLPAILALLEQELSPDAVCQQLGLCSTVNKVSKIEVNKVQASAVSCSTCKLFVELAEKFIKSKKSEEEIEKLLDHICDLLPGYGDECTEMVNKYYPTIVLLLSEELTPEDICNSIGLCPTKEKQAVVALASPPKCDICVEALTFFKDLFKNYTKDDIKGLLYKICGVLPAFQDECKQYVDQYLVLVINFVIDNPPSTLCKMEKFCSAGLPVTSSFPIAVKSTTSCEVCKLVAQELDRLIQGKSVQSDIELALDKVCDILPSQYKDECTAIVDTYTPTIIQLLLDEVSPDELCNALGLCSTKVLSREQTTSIQEQIMQFLNQICDDIPDYGDQCKQYISSFEAMVISQIQKMSAAQLCTAASLCMTSEPTLKVVKSSSVSCAICEYAMDQLEKLVQENSTEAEIQTALDKLCGLLPSTLKADCTEFVNTYSKTIIQLLLQQVKPSVICTTLKLCNSSKQVEVKAKGDQIEANKYTVVNDIPLLQLPDVAINPVKTSDELCLACQIAVNYLSEALNENSTDTEILKILQAVCSYFPGDLKQEVHDENSKFLLLQITLIFKNYEIRIQHWIVDLIFGHFFNNKKCTVLVSEYGFKIIKLIQNKIDPKVICTELEICSNGSRFKQGHIIMQRLKVISAQKTAKKAKDTTLFFKSKQRKLDTKAVVMEMAPKIFKALKQKPPGIVDAVHLLKDKLPDIKEKAINLEKRKENRRKQMLRRKYWKKEEDNFILRTL